MSAITGDWKNVIVGEKTYKDGWYLLEKGGEITGYGEAKLNWLINYNTGEVIELKDGEYTIANANASGALVDETLKLNIDPVNLQNPEKWGDNISFIGEDEESSESGVKETEIKFDGVDDYLKIEDVNIDRSGGFTFEFFGKLYDEKKTILGKSKFKENGEIEDYLSDFRFNGEFNCLRVTLSRFDCESDLSEFDILGKNQHFLRFGDVSILDGENTYISFSVDFNSLEMKAYQNGILKQKTICSRNYIDGSKDLFDSSLPFTLGLIVQGFYERNYSKLDLYSCRLYTRILTDDEILTNFTASTNYHDNL